MKQELSGDTSSPQVASLWGRVCCLSIGTAGLVYPLLWFFMSNQRLAVAWYLWLIALPFLALFVFPSIFLWQVSGGRFDGGIRPLFDREKIEPENVTERSIRFGAAPRLWWALTWRLLAATFALYYAVKPACHWLVYSALEAGLGGAPTDDLIGMRATFYALPFAGAATFVLAQIVMFLCIRCMAGKAQRKTRPLL